MMEKRCLIEITETRAIGSSTTDWSVMKRTKLTDKATKNPSGGYSEWGAYAFFSSYENAAQYLEGELIRTCGATTLPALMRSAKNIHEMLLEIHEKARLL
jgi:hypothetical protein